MTKRKYWLALGYGSVSLMSGVGLMGCAAWLISRAAQHPPILVLSFAVVGVRALALSRAGFRYLERLSSHDAAFRMLGQQRVRLFRALIPLAPTGLATFQRGDLISRLCDDVDTLQDRPLRVHGPITAVLAAAGLSLGMVFLTLPLAGAVFLLALIGTGLGVPLITGYVARISDQRQAQVRGHISALTLELCEVLPDLVIYGATADRLAELERCAQDRARLNRRSAIASGWGVLIAVLGSGVAVVAILLVALPAVKRGRLAPELLAFITLVPLVAMEAISTLTPAASAAYRVKKSEERLDQVFQATPAVLDLVETPLPLSMDVPQLILNNMSAHWPHQKLPKLSMELPPGIKIGITGPSGSGKSSLAYVLLRFLNYSGDIKIGTTDLAALPTDQVRRIIGLSTQDPHIFDSSLRANLLVAQPNATDSELEEVLAQVRLGGWFQELHQGLDTALGRRGSAISGGQSQRIAIARLILADHKIWILDEPTAQLDHATAQELLRDLLELSGDRTVMLITHRIGETAELLDQVVRLQG